MVVGVVAGHVTPFRRVIDGGAQLGEVLDVGSASSLSTPAATSNSTASGSGP
jgi:hypothetical protein